MSSASPVFLPPSRNRRDCFGELLQIDGYPHDWFEGRAPKCCLLFFADDATGQLMHLRFGYPKNRHRPVTESAEEPDDMFT